MKRATFYPILIVAALALFAIIIISTGAFSLGLGGIFFAVLAAGSSFLVLTIGAIAYEIAHPIKRNADGQQDRAFRQITTLSALIFVCALITSLIYVWPSLGSHLFYNSLYFLCRIALLFLSGLTLYLSFKKIGFARFTLLFACLLLIAMQVSGIGFFGYESSDNMNYNKERIVRATDLRHQDQAVASGSVEGCLAIPDPSLSAGCVSSVAAKKNDSSICSSISSSASQTEKEWCYIHIARQDNDSNACYAAADANKADARFFMLYCLEPIAVTQKDLTLCDSFDDYNKKYSAWTNDDDINTGITWAVKDCRDQVNNGKIYFN